MAIDRNRDQGAGRIAAALSASLNALSELQESQKRIENRQKKSAVELDRYSGLLLQIGKDFEEGLGAIEGRIKSVRASTDSLGKSIESSKEKKPIRWKHNIRAGAVISGALAFGLMIGWMWALGWLRVDETARMAREKERMIIKNEWQAMINEKLAMDAEREIGRVVLAKVGYADDEQRNLILRLISSEAMSKKDRKKLKKWLETRSRKRRKVEYHLDLGTILSSE